MQVYVYMHIYIYTYCIYMYIYIHIYIYGYTGDMCRVRSLQLRVSTHLVSKQALELLILIQRGPEDMAPDGWYLGPNSGYDEDVGSIL